MQRLWVEALFCFLTRPLNFRLRALVLKDFKSFFRDTTQWSQLILLTALVIVYLYNFRVLPLDKTPLPTFFLQNLVSFLNMALAGFVLSAVSVRFVFPAVSLEGLSFWTIRSSPLSPRTFLWGKFWTSLIPLLILAEILPAFGEREQLRCAGFVDFEQQIQPEVLLGQEEAVPSGVVRHGRRERGPSHRVQ